MNASLDMTLRDWFAGMVMQAMAGRGDLYLNDKAVEAITHDAYAIADAMLAEREAHNANTSPT